LSSLRLDLYLSSKWLSRYIQFRLSPLSSPLPSSCSGEPLPTGRQAPEEREIIGVFSLSFRLKNGIEFVMNKNPVSFLVNGEEGKDDSFF